MDENEKTAVMEIPRNIARQHKVTSQTESEVQTILVILFDFIFHSFPPIE